MNEKSYTELMKLGAMNRKKEKEMFIQDLYIEMLLSEVLLQAEKEKLLKLIDEAIDNRDRPAFLQLSEQLKELNKRFGT
ncbi:IDEAL domain-containing protein [Bacillus methanolicus]|uniref:IDEAL domain-containing protein n=1 Tax=Bacillus methanolicus (strain MGA3 / ATCC 53907) TaxID=796606 RepID=I3E7I7_BACMM|nr:IDEAL domain-containing protein [Bacillus methanolicus]AIE59284.1 hypothetical protein BMMGA3_04220 [Bacillus methanolicus MGA3]EIJ82458.1 hypothetical protein MGA3_04420 [Bacillus methanolicus MGA3]UQD51356.1 IDEAL domain-containing protein [Bacillus methanolicus]